MGASVYGMFAALAATDPHPMYEDRSPNKRVIKQDFGDGDTAQRIRQGQKKFFYDTDKFVWARTEKSAKRKIKNKIENEKED